MMIEGAGGREGEQKVAHARVQRSRTTSQTRGKTFSHAERPRRDQLLGEGVIIWSAADGSS
jgi:hypothetical protein